MFMPESGRVHLDGLLLKFKAGKKKEIQFTAYGGFNTPVNYDFKEYGSLSNDFLAGASIGYYGMQGTCCQPELSWTGTENRMSYTAPRLDSMHSIQPRSSSNPIQNNTTLGRILILTMPTGRCLALTESSFTILNRKDIVPRRDKCELMLRDLVRFSAWLPVQRASDELQFTIFWTFDA
jgi:hypothetical protein